MAHGVIAAPSAPLEWVRWAVQAKPCSQLWGNGVGNWGGQEGVGGLGWGVGRWARGHPGDGTYLQTSVLWTHQGFQHKYQSLGQEGGCRQGFEQLTRQGGFLQHPHRVQPPSPEQPPQGPRSS